MSFVVCKQEVSFCCRLRETIDANMDVVNDDLVLRCSFLDELYTKLYVLHCGAYWERAEEFGLSKKWLCMAQKLWGGIIGKRVLLSRRIGFIILSPCRVMEKLGS